MAAGLEKVKAEKQTQPGLEVMEAHLNRIIMEVSSQQKMSYFKRRLVIYVPVRFGNPASQGKLAALGLLRPSALLKCLIPPSEY